MITVDHSITINKPLEEVFEYVSDPTKQVEWQEGLEGVEKTSDGPIGVGSTFVEKRKFLGRELESTFEVTEWEPNKSFAYEVKEGPVPFELQQTFSQADGGTKVDVHIEGEPGGFFKLAGGMFSKQLKSSLEEDSARLKKMLEG